MQRITSITLNNFKFFIGDKTSHPHNRISLDRKNLLVYGENGSGKSSIYWALYTFLQSCLKQNDNEIFKYFRPNEIENLRNRFANDNDPAGIEVHFENDSRVPEIREITNANINTKHDAFIRKTLDSSDFLTYKYLSKIYDFRNSELIDLFPLFESELLMFIDLGEEFYLHNGNLSGTTNASDWWKFILDAPNKLPYKGNIVSVSTQEYIRFKTKTIPKFIELLKKFLFDITQSTNEYLVKKFKEDYSVNFDIDSIECDYNKHISTRAKDGKLYIPKIPLLVNFDHLKLSVDKRKIVRPHTFLNEARLTAVALAMRLAILDQRPKFPDSSRILVIDDLLVSLDMSHRNTVLDIILEKVKDYQLLILTHDKLFFEIAKHKTKQYDNSNWKCMEMYSCEKNGIPQPLIFDSDSYLAKAEKYFHLKEYEIAGNFLRKEAESFCKEFLPKKLQYTSDFNQLDLNGLIVKCSEYVIENGLEKLLFDELDSHRKFVLNPTSHDSYDVPKFNSEIGKCLQTLKELRRIQFKSVLNKGDKVEYGLHDGTNGYKFEIHIQDDFRLIKIDAKASTLTSGLVNFYIHKDGIKGELKHEKVSIKKMYEKHYAASNKAKSASFWDEVIFTLTGLPLNTIKIF